MIVCALAASLGAALGAFCDGCSVSNPSSPLPWVGASWYAALLAASVARPLQGLIPVALMLSCAGHTSLVLLMIFTRRPCVLCFVAAAAAFLAAGIVVRRNMRLILNALLICALAATLTWGHVTVFEPYPEVRWGSGPDGTDALSAVKDSAGHPAGVVVLTKAGCPYCVRMTNDVIPRLRSAYGERLWVRSIPATEVPIRTRVVPTVILVKNGKSVGYIDGFCPFERLEKILSVIIAGRG